MAKAGLLSAVTLACATFSGQAQALTFNLIDLGGTATGTQARLGFEIAAAYWSSVLTDNVTMNLNIGFSQLGTGILGSTGSARSLIGMTQGYNALARDRTSALDRIAVANLRGLGASNIDIANGMTGAVTVIGNAFNPTTPGSYIDTATRIDNDGSTNNSSLAITKASAKALGITTDINNNAINYNSADATIRFSSAFAFDFDARDGIASNAFDFVGVAIHEIGHALGFVSGVDSYDAFTAPGSTSVVTSGGVVVPTALEDFVVASQLDLFRYSSPGNLDWSTQNTPYFSIDGVNQLFGDSRMSQGVANGDGRQASHFKDSAAGVPQLGVLDPTSARGQLQEVTALDLAAFDAIGWNVNFDVLANPGYRINSSVITSNFVAQLPEPGTWLSMILGFGAVGATMRRRRPAAVTA